jgi:CheY-like chemotaxis protein
VRRSAPRAVWKPLEALDQLGENERISILITDINMPGMDGHELGERAKRLKPQLKILQLSAASLAGTGTR